MEVAIQTLDPRQAPEHTIRFGRHSTILCRVHTWGRFAGTTGRVKPSTSPLDCVADADVPVIHSKN